MDGWMKFDDWINGWMLRQMDGELNKSWLLLIT